MKCPKHPRYRALKPPTSECDDCIDMYLDRTGTRMIIVDCRNSDTRLEVVEYLEKSFLNLSPVRFGSGPRNHAQIDYIVSDVARKVEVRSVLKEQFPKKDARVLNERE